MEKCLLSTQLSLHNSFSIIELSVSSKKAKAKVKSLVLKSCLISCVVSYLVLKIEAPHFISSLHFYVIEMGKIEKNPFPSGD